MEEALRVLRDAAEAIEIGSEKHGATEPSFRMIGELWSIYLVHKREVRGPDIQEDDVSQMMVLLKIARSVYGDHADNFIDQAGYSSLTALFRSNK